ncbi:hypothetical protein M513_14153 [Trichuris suis]|uniref:Peptidase S1 domain-containing protein n=1 Tax=Trichuris suis TaxID=68888 RepID=A0A085LJ24_9BILA|nr:hypothetical protein M513_14153 [Trichuris suis]
MAPSSYLPLAIAWESKRYIICSLWKKKKNQYFRKQRGQWLDVSSIAVHIAPTSYSRLNRGLKNDVRSGYTYAIPNDIPYVKYGVAILKLKDPVFYKQGAIPVCLAAAGSVPTPSSVCFASGFHKREGYVREEKVRIFENVRCLELKYKNVPTFVGFCAYNEAHKKVLRSGAPLVCIENHRAVQYGVYVAPANNQAGEAKLGFYEGMRAVHQAVSDARFTQEPGKLPHGHEEKRRAPKKPKKDHRKSSSSSSDSSYRVYRSSGIENLYRHY